MPNTGAVYVFPTCTDTLTKSVGTPGSPAGGSGRNLPYIVAMLPGDRGPGRNVAALTMASWLIEGFGCTTPNSTFTPSRDAVTISVLPSEFMSATRSAPGAPPLKCLGAANAPSPRPSKIATLPVLSVPRLL